LPWPFYVKLVGIGLAAAAFLWLRQPRARRYARPLAVGIIALAYVLTALSGIVSPSREYATTALLFVGASLTTAAIGPWGLWLRLATGGVGALWLAAAVVWGGGTLRMAVPDPGAAVVIAFALSAVTAAEVNRYRLAHRLELHRRRRAEVVTRRLNAQLEQRVR